MKKIYSEIGRDFVYPATPRVLNDIRESLPSLLWDELEISDSWERESEVNGVQFSNCIVSLTFRGQVRVDDQDGSQFYYGKAIYQSDDVKGMSWALKMLEIHSK